MSKLTQILIAIIIALLLVFFSRSTPHGAEEKTIVLTFDDGPNPAVLKELLPLLKTHSVRASFFVVGSTVVGNEMWIERETLDGHSIENHSWGHENMKKTFAKHGGEAITSSLEKTAQTIKKITGKNPAYFRPPFWEINKEIESIASAKGYRVMKLGDPDLNSLDYDDVKKKRDASILIARVKTIVQRREANGSFHHIFAFHELPITIEAMKVLIPYFKNQDYVFKNLEYASLAPKK